MAVGLSILALPWLWAAPDLATRPVVSVPWGASWLAAHVDPTAAAIAAAGTAVGAGLGVVGVWPRAGFGLAAVCGVYALGIAQLHGAVHHDHHLLWLAALLAVTPERGPGAALGIRFSWAILAAVFFFPGLHKWLSHGVGWAGENLLLQLQWKWAESWAFEPLFRLDRWPGMLRTGGLAVLGFELLAPLAMPWAPSRAAWVAGALVFHACTAWFFDIHFPALWVCYVAFLPGDAEPGEGPTWPVWLVGGGLLVGITAAGVPGIVQGWPFACYPTFDQRVGPWMPTVALVGVGSDGAEVEVPERALADPRASQAFYAEAWGIAGHYGPVDAAAQRAWLDRIARRPEVAATTAGAVELRLYRAEKAVDPDQPSIRRGELLIAAPRSPDRPRP